MKINKVNKKVSFSEISTIGKPENVDMIKDAGKQEFIIKLFSIIQSIQREVLKIIQTDVAIKILENEKKLKNSNLFPKNKKL